MTHSIKRDTTSNKEKYYTVLSNPYCAWSNSKVIYGGSEQIVTNKINKQLKQWESEPKIEIVIPVNQIESEYDILPF